MQLNRDTLNRLLSQSDDALWKTIRSIAAAAGLKIDRTPTPSEMQALRAALSGASDRDIKSALDALKAAKESGEQHE